MNELEPMRRVTREDFSDVARGLPTTTEMGKKRPSKEAERIRWATKRAPNRGKEKDAHQKPKSKWDWLFKLLDHNDEIVINAAMRGLKHTSRDGSKIRSILSMTRPYSDFHWSVTLCEHGSFRISRGAPWETRGAKQAPVAARNSASEGGPQGPEDKPAEQTQPVEIEILRRIPANDLRAELQAFQRRLQCEYDAATQNLKRLEARLAAVNTTIEML